MKSGSHILGPLWGPGQEGIGKAIYLVVVEALWMGNQVRELYKLVKLLQGINSVQPSPLIRVSWWQGLRIVSPL